MHIKTQFLKVDLSTLQTFLILGFSLLGIVVLQSSTLHSQSLGMKNNLNEKVYQAEREKEKRQLNFLNTIPSLGFNNILADWVYLHFIQYFGDDKAREKSDYSLSKDYFSQIVQRDPLFMEALFRLDIATSLFAGNPQESTKLLGKALDEIPDYKFITNLPPYYLWRSKGNNELLFLGNVQLAKHDYLKSIELADIYNTKDSQRIKVISQQSIDFLNQNPDSRLARIGAWIGILSNRPDPKTFKRVISEIEKLGGEVSISSQGEVTIRLSK